MVWCGGVRRGAGVVDTCVCGDEGSIQQRRDGVVTEACAYVYVCMQVPAVSSKVYLESCQKAAQTLASAVLGSSGPCPVRPCWPLSAL